MIKQIVLPLLRSSVVLHANLFFDQRNFVSQLPCRQKSSPLSPNNHLFQPVGGSHRHLIFSSDLVNYFLDILVRSLCLHVYYDIL